MPNLHKPECSKENGCDSDCQEREFVELNDILLTAYESLAHDYTDKEIEVIRQQAVGCLDGLRYSLNMIYSKRIQAKEKENAS